MMHRSLKSPLFPYTTLFRSPLRGDIDQGRSAVARRTVTDPGGATPRSDGAFVVGRALQNASGNAFLPGRTAVRSEEHTSELQSRLHLVCRLLLEIKKLFNIH